MVLLVVFWFPDLVPSSGILLQCEITRHQSTCSMSFYLLSCIYLLPVWRLYFAHVLIFAFWGSGSSANMVTNVGFLDCRMNLQSGKNYVGPVSRLKEGKGQTLLVVTLYFVLAGILFLVWLQNLVSFCSKNAKRLILKPWLHSFLLAGAYSTCVQVYFVSVHFIWKLGVEVGGVWKA